MENNKNNNGPVDVNGDVTPITKKTVEQVDASQWNDMNIGELWDQRVFIQNRLNMVLNNSGHPDTIKALQNGLGQLDTIIHIKSINRADNTSSTAIGLL